MHPLAPTTETNCVVHGEEKRRELEPPVNTQENQYAKCEDL